MRSISPVAAIILLTLISVVLYYAIEMLKRSLVTWRP
jgi:ABC-type nitrate/sulfonate/bicarbonate transport system permease component